MATRRRAPAPHPDQLWLDGMEPPAWKDALFFALFPDDATAQCIAALAQEQRTAHGFTEKALATSRLHVTLHFLGEFAGLPGDVHAKAAGAGSRVHAAPFQAAFDQVLSFKGKDGHQPRVLCADGGNAALQDFRHRLGEALRVSGFSVDQDYVPHVTLLYDKGVERQPVEPVVWEVRQFALVHSLRGLGQYRVLERWDLEGGAERQ